MHLLSTCTYYAFLYQLLCPFFADWNDYCRQFTITFPQLPQYFIVCHPDDATKYIVCNEQGIHLYSGNCIDGKVLKVETIPSLSRTCVDPPQLPKCVNPLITTTQGTWITAFSCCNFTPVRAELRIHL